MSRYATSHIGSQERPNNGSILRTLLLAIIAMFAFSLTAAAGPIIKIKLGLPSLGCRGFGFCGITIENGIPAELAFDGQQALTASFQEMPSERGDLFRVEEPIFLDRQTAGELGAKGMVIMPGQYPVDYQSNPNGVVRMNARPLGLTIGIDVGRKSRGCTGFGICKITIDIDLKTQTPATASLNGDVMTIDFLKRPVAQGEPFVIDEAITLDDETALALGRKSVTILPGTYEVDYSTSPNGSVQVATRSIGITINIEIGRRSQGCRGFGICSITIGMDLERPHPSVGVLNGNTLTLDFTQKFATPSTAIVIDEDITVDPATARALGAKSLTIVRGTYPIDYSNNPNGTMNVQTLRTGLTLNVEIGRRSQGCHGFGICRIWIELDAANNGTASVATLNGSTLTVDFTSPLKEHGDVMTIDEDIVLDAATSRALGAKSLTILRGSYPVDYSSNPNGTVNLQTQRFGITIHIETGRRSKGCTGFGICSITIDVSLRSQPAVAVLNGSTLTLDFVSPLSERGDVMTIDETIELDEKAAHALGASRVVVLPGQYRVDYLNNPNGTVNLATQRFGITIHVETGRRSKGCTGFGICSITIELDLRKQPAVGTLNGNTLTLAFTSPLKEHGDVMIIDEPIQLDEATANALGADKVVVMPGEYRVDYSKNSNGTVNLQTQRFGLTINVQIGRRFQGCTGLGICSITIGFNLADRNVPAVASLDGNEMTLVFASELPEQGDVLVIDQNFDLDARLAHQLGAKHVTVLEGAYQIQRNAQGKVVVKIRIRRVGITVTIYFGRTSACNPGFGICKVTVDWRFRFWAVPMSGLNLWNNAAPAVATYENGKLRLAFMNDAPYRESFMTIDETVTLDSAEAAALGVQTILPGVYAVDSSDNEYGTVELNAQATGTSSVEMDELSSTNGKATIAPNPASGTTALGFWLSRDGAVEVTLHDLRGNLVATLVDGEMMEAGRQSVSFDAGSLDEGVYFFTIRSASGVETGRMTVTR